jgi:Arc/MetJ-type ribon-helix-helix transcriptional regulator
MKNKLSITLDDETVFAIQNAISSGRFRNKSHVVEFAVRRLIEEKNG